MFFICTNPYTLRSRGHHVHVQPSAIEDFDFSSTTYTTIRETYIFYPTCQKHKPFNQAYQSRKLSRETSSDVGYVSVGTLRPHHRTPMPDAFEKKKIKKFQLACVTGGVGSDVTAGNRPRAGRCARPALLFQFELRGQGLTSDCNTSCRIV